MAPLPKRRHSTRRQGKRNAAIPMIHTGLVKCPQCGIMKQIHRICPGCGYYNAREVIKPKAPKETSKHK